MSRIHYQDVDRENEITVSVANPLPVSASVTVSGTGPYPSTPVAGFQQISAATLAASTALTIPGTATFAIVQAEAGDVRWRDDGTAPTGAIGMLLEQGQSMILAGTSITNAHFIEATGSGANLNVSYYK